MAEDGGNPPQSATVLAEIEILRNFEAPRFDPRDYNPEISETLGLGKMVTQVNAVDSDTKVYNLLLYNLHVHGLLLDN